MSEWIKRTLAILLAIIALILTISAIQAVSYTFDLLRVQTGVPVARVGIVEDIPLPEIEEISDIEKFYSYNKSLDVFPNGLITSSINVNNWQSYSKRISVVGSFEDAYLYVRAEGGEPNKNLKEANWASIYVLFNNIHKTDWETNSGHLLRKLSLIPLSEKDNYTEVLYNLKSIPLTHIPYNDNADPDKNANWFSLINNSNNFDIGGFISIENRYGKILKMEIRYKCKDGSDCYIK
jgi:hypothetical protein